MGVYLSIIIPARRAGLTITAEILALDSFLSEKGYTHEILVLDNRSGSDEALAFPSNVRVIHPAGPEHMKQNISYIRGFKAAKGLWAVLLDEDQVSNYASIEKLIKSLDSGYDVIWAYRARKRHDNPMRFAGSIVVNFIFNAGTGRKFRDIGCSLSAATRPQYKKVIEPRYRVFYEFSPYLVLASDARVKEIPIDEYFEAERSSYSILTLLVLAFHAVKLKFILRAFLRDQRA